MRDSGEYLQCLNCVLSSYSGFLVAGGAVVSGIRKVGARCVMVAQVQKANSSQTQNSGDWSNNTTMKSTYNLFLPSFLYLSRSFRSFRL